MPSVIMLRAVGITRLTKAVGPALQAAPAEPFGYLRGLHDVACLVLKKCQIFGSPPRQTLVQMAMEGSCKRGERSMGTTHCRTADLSVHAAAHSSLCKAVPCAPRVAAGRRGGALQTCWTCSRTVLHCSK